MLNFLKEKSMSLVLLVSSVLVYLSVKIQWGHCPEIDCSHQLIDNWLRTLGTGSLFLVGYFTFFLFLPVLYFKTWFKYVFSWGLPLVVYLTYITTGSSSIPAYGKVDVVRFWGIAFSVITVLFIVFRYVREKKKK